MTSLPDLIEQQKKEFEKEFRVYREDDPSVGLAEYAYFDLDEPDPDKVLAFLTTSLTLAYEAGRKAAWKGLGVEESLDEAITYAKALMGRRLTDDEISVLSAGRLHIISKAEKHGLTF